MTTKPSARLTLSDRLSRLNFPLAVKLLGPGGARLITRGGQNYEVDVLEQVELTPEQFRLTLPGPSGDARVTIWLSDDRRQRLMWRCSDCDEICEHVGAAVSVILEEKTPLGLAVPPDPKTPVESLSEEELLRRALEERAERARKEKMTLRSADTNRPWTDYMLTSALSGKTYRVALRGPERGDSYCSCPDFRTNTLGTCKHIMHVLAKVRKRFPQSALSRPYRRKRLSLHLKYGAQIELRLQTPERVDAEVDKIIRPLRDRPIEDLRDLLSRIRKLEGMGHEVSVYPDAEQYIQERLYQERIAAKVAEIRRDPANHPLRRELLKTELLPYQLDGIAFAVGAGRAILADEMGLGKTIQGIGVAELLAREAGLARVLIICPASLKSQWRIEIGRFSDRSCQLVLGGAAERANQYANDSFFTVCNYEQVLRDILAIERVPWDLIILDEGQRIKNWEAKTSAVIKSLKSPFALVLTGTPLENRLDDLFSVVQFIDDRRLAPAFRFFNRHRVVDEKGKVLGYKNLDELRANLRPLLLRRTRSSVMSELPERSTEIVRVTPTDEQRELHAAHMRVVLSIIRKAFLSEMDLLRLQRALLMCRLVANTTYLVEKKRPPGYSSKLERFDELIDQLFQEKDRKSVLFSEWTTMLDLIEPRLKQRGLDFVRLDGSVPQRLRQQLVHRFQNDSDCRLFITTNAGSTGLNLQAANTVINFDLPWNPAVLEQRIGRAHRMGQKRPVQVYVLVTEGTMEENLLNTLSAKHDLFLAALDVESDVNEVSIQSNMEELKRRLEVLLGARPEAPIDETVRSSREQEIERFSRRERVAAAGGEMLGAAFQFLGELVAGEMPSQPRSDLVADLKSRLSECVEEDPQGRPRLTVTLPDRTALDGLASTLAKLLLAGESATSTKM